MRRDLSITLLLSLLSFSQHKIEEEGSISGESILLKDETRTGLFTHLDIIAEHGRYD